MIGGIHISKIITRQFFFLKQWDNKLRFIPQLFESYWGYPGPWKIAIGIHRVSCPRRLGNWGVLCQAKHAQDLCLVPYSPSRNTVIVARGISFRSFEIALGNGWKWPRPISIQVTCEKRLLNYQKVSYAKPRKVIPAATLQTKFQDLAYFPLQAA